MDKNFINIDDLVRQRLGGGEEHEQAGSWGRMRDLLDKEMPQKKPAGLYWRRSLSAIALLLLVAGASVGGYEMMKNKNAAQGTTTGTIAAATAVNNTNNGTIAANHELNNTNENKTTSTNTNETKTINSIAATTTTAKDVSGEAKPIAADVPVKEHKKHRSAVAVSDNKTIAANNNKSVTTNNKDNNKEQHIAANNKRATVKNAESNTVAHEKAIAKENEAAKAVATVADKKNTTNNSNSAPVTTGKETMADMPLSSSAPSVAANKAATVKSKTASGDHKKTTLPSVKVAAKTNSGNTHKTAATVANNIPVAETTEEVPGNDNTAKTARKSRHATANKVAAVTTHTKPAAKVAATPVATVLSATMGNTANNNTKTAVAKNTHKSQKKVQRLVLAQHTVKISPTQVKYILDTISMESATEDLEFAMAPAAFGPQSYEKFMSTTEETSEAVAVKDNHVKKSKGSGALENLNAAFNDMKTKVKGAHFSPGITGGINGTFFGPNSFRGFQFGITGNETFSETFAVQAELKYFNRISNNYSLNDNYYTYTPSAGGFTKTMVVNPYSINTLQSIEMPISVRYCTGNFNFYVGGNMAYSFAINSGAYPLADPSSATQVATVGNDNGPKIQTDDFRSRFGLGYLVGASCRVSPNVTIDFRNVQNLWDNSSTSGAKIVSGQLYKSPSLQLSIGYRFGGNRTNKE